MKLVLFYFDNKANKMFIEKKLEDNSKVISLSSPNNFVLRDEIVLRVIDVDKPEDAKKYIDNGYNYYHLVPYFKFKKGAGVYFDEANKCYRASMYGFIVIDRTKTLRIISPLQISKDKTVANYILFPSKLARIPSYNDIDELMQISKIITPVEKHILEEKLQNINPAERRVTKLTVAKSKAPIIGRKEYFMPLIPLEKQAGKVMSDGHMDFKEINSIIQVTKGQELLERFPEIKPVDGFNIYGEKVSAQMEEPKGYSRGDNIVQSGTDENIFVSALDGCLVVESRKISVKPVAVIGHNVDYESGNIDFNGSVHIKGSVLPGFSVKAQGDIVIEGNVDDAIIETQGSITVSMGIGGKGNSLVKAGGNVKCKYILNAKVEAGLCITVEDSIINSKVFANDKVFVVSQHAKIMGGETIARHEIDVNFAGSPKETATILTVGRNLEVERELAEIRREMSNYKEMVEDVMQQIKTSFGANLFEDPKKFIAILPAIKKKQCLQLLSDLSKYNKSLKELAVKGMKTEEKLVLDQEPVILVKEKIYPGTNIYIKKNGKSISEEMQNCKFYEDKEEKIIRISSAV